MTSHNGQKIIAIHILSNISRKTTRRSVNLVQHDKLFSGKITHKMWWRGLTQTCLSIFKDYIWQLVTFKTYTKNVREKRTKCTLKT